MDTSPKIAFEHFDGITDARRFALIGPSMAHEFAAKTARKPRFVPIGRLRRAAEGAPGGRSDAVVRTTTC